MPQTIHFKQLDSLRFVAFLFVFWQHGFAAIINHSLVNSRWQQIGLPVTMTGGIGVHLFFVISGFLITYMLLKEKEATGRINLRYFYIRRILRIWPLYYAVLLTGIFILPKFSASFEFTGNVLMNLIFLNNFDMEHNAPHVCIAWSVAIEEQFYLLWPLIVIVLSDKRLLFAFCLLVFIASITFIAINPTNPFYTFSNLNYLMAGCMGAIVYAGKTAVFSLVDNMFLLAATIGVAAIFIVLKHFSGIVHFASLLVLPACYLYWVIYAVHRNGQPRLPLLSYLGKYTYGMYLLHPIVIILISRQPVPPSVFIAMACLLMTIAISVASYEFFEKRFLLLKNRFAIVKTRI